MPHCQKTYDEMRAQIELYGRSIAVQPTGTGKSSILIKFLEDYKQVWKVVVAPTDESIVELRSKPNWIDERTITITYQNIKKLEDYIGILDIGLIALDEAHRASAKVWGQNVNSILDSFKNAVVIGFTATPIHYLDGKKDIVEMLFNGISAGNITIQEAITAGILPKPTQVEVMFSISKDIQKTCDRIKKAYKKKTKDKKEKENVEECIEDCLSDEAKEAIQVLEAYELNWATNARDKAIIGAYKTYIGQYTDKNYKHIVFMPTIATVSNMLNNVKYWFESVFPEKTINIYVVHSKHKQSDFNMSEFRREKSADNIDVLVAVNMANESLHVRNTKSVTMLRYTKSPNLFIQQMGRALSIGGEDPIIFDFIGNIAALSDVEDFIQGIESKVSNLYKDNIERQLKANAAKIFATYDDQTEGFRKLLDSFSDVVPKGSSGASRVKWEERLLELKNVLESSKNSDDFNVMPIKAFEEIQDIKLRKWAIDQRLSYIQGSMESYKKTEFKEVVGDMVYKTPAMVHYGLQWFNVVDQLKQKIENVNTEALKFRIYCNKVPQELLAYMRDTDLEVDLNFEWFKKTCYKYDKDLTDRFVYIVENIVNNPQINISSPEFDINVYADICQAVIKLRHYFTIYENREDSREAVLFNLFLRYWRLNISVISSNIEMDLGALTMHHIIIKGINGQINEDEEQMLRKMVLEVPEQLRAKSINILLSRVGYIDK